MVAPLAPTIMTKTPKNGSSSSTPTPGGPASVGTGPPPSVGSTKSEPIDANDAASSGAPSGPGGGAGQPGTPHSLPENSNSVPGSKPDDGTENSTLNGGTGAPPGASNNDGLHCDNNNPNNQNPDGSQGGGVGEPPNQADNQVGDGSNPNQNSNINDPNNQGAQIKQEDVKPNASNCSTPGGMPGQQNASSVLPSDTDLFDGFDSKDGGKIILI